MKNTKRIGIGRSAQGFTLIELMISMAIFGVISLAAFSVLSSSQQSAVMNDQTVQIQKNLRLAMDLIARDIRMTGFSNPVAGALPGCANHMNPLNTNPDSIAIMTLDQQLGTLAVSAQNSSVLTLAAGGVLPGVGDAISIEGIFTTTVSSVSGGSTINLNQRTPASSYFPASSAVMRLVCVTYTVSGANGQVPGGATIYKPYQLLRNTTATANNALPIVDGIEDLQLAYALDADGNGVIDDQAGGTVGVVDCHDYVPNNVACTSAVPYTAGSGTVTTLPVSVNSTPTAVRQVRITLVGRAIPPEAANTPNNCWWDQQFTGNTQMQVEDHLLLNPVQPGTCPAPQITGGIRRRSLTRIITLRDANTS